MGACAREGLGGAAAHRGARTASRARDDVLLVMDWEFQVRNTVIHNTALATLAFAFACSHGEQDRTGTTDTITPVMPFPPPPMATAGEETAAPANGQPAAPQPPTNPPPPPPPASTTDTPPAASTPVATAPEADDETCEPEPPMVIPCTDDINEDRPDLPCSQWVEWGTCEESWMIERHVCDRSCGRCTEDQIIEVESSCNSSSSPPTEPPPPAPPVSREGPTLPPIEGGQPGFTTRYWDCCKPHCGWPGNAGNPLASCDHNNMSLGGDHGATSACEGGPAHMCWNYVPQTNGDNIAYAFAAHNGVPCGACFQLDFTGESKNPKPETGHDFGSQSLKGKSMIVQVINTGGIEPGQFDLLVPGGGVGDFDACSAQWGGVELGERYGGFFLACQKEHDFDYEPARQCAREWCDRAFSDKPELHAGCSWFVEWFALADNPTMTYQQVDCPPELSSVSGL